MKVSSLGITWETKLREFFDIMAALGWPEEVELPTEEYEIVKSKFIHKENVGHFGESEFCWRETCFKPLPAVRE